MNATVDMRKTAVECRQRGCGYTWQKDPVTAVPCPVCKAKIGTECSTVAPSGHRKSKSFGNALPAWGHDERDIAAADSGAYCHPCPGRHGRCSCELATSGPGVELAKRKSAFVPLHTHLGTVAELSFNLGRDSGIVIFDAYWNIKCPGCGDTGVQGAYWYDRDLRDDGPYCSKYCPIEKAVKA